MVSIDCAPAGGGEGDGGQRGASFLVPSPFTCFFFAGRLRSLPLYYRSYYASDSSSSTFPCCYSPPPFLFFVLLPFSLPPDAIGHVT